MTLHFPMHYLDVLWKLKVQQMEKNQLLDYYAHHKCKSEELTVRVTTQNAVFLFRFSIFLTNRRS